MDRIFEFQWPVDEDGYEIINVDPKPKPLNSLARRWKQQEGLDLEPGKYIKPRGGIIRTQRLCDDYPALFAEFANTPKTEKGVLTFASNFGLLLPSSVAQLPGPHEKLDFWFEMIELVEDIVQDKDALDTEGGIYLSGIEIGLTPAKRAGARPSISMRPESLMDAILMQSFFHLAAPQGTLMSCSRCGKWFHAGSGTGKRTTAKYCSKQCSDRANYERRKGRSKKTAKTKKTTGATKASRFA